MQSCCLQDAVVGDRQYVFCNIYVSPRAAPGSAARQESAAFFAPPAPVVIAQAPPPPPPPKRPAMKALDEVVSTAEAEEAPANSMMTDDEMEQHLLSLLGDDDHIL